jgi:hypothetical protein
VVAVLALLWLLGPVPWMGHPVEVAVPLLWAYATVLSRRNRRPAAAVVLGLSVLIAPFAVLGFPCLLAVSGPARAVRIALPAVAVAALGYLPFVLSGQFGMFGHVWPVATGTLPHLLGLREVTWAARLAQAVVVAGGCALVAHRLRGRPMAIAAAPAAAALLRVATDPLVFDYYWLPVSAGVVLLVALLPDGLPRWRIVLVIVLEYLTVMAATTDRGPLGALVCLAGYALVGMPVPERISSSRRPAGARR